MHDFKYSRQGLKLTEHFEGLRLTAYQDVAGVWTIGYGHTGADVKPGMTITLAEAEGLLSQDIQKAADAVNRLVTYDDLTQNQFDALVDFTFNVGISAFAGSTLLRKLNEADVAGAAAEFPKWCMAGGKVVEGLVRRRQKEATSFYDKDCRCDGFPHPVV